MNTIPSESARLLPLSVPLPLLRYAPPTAVDPSGPVPVTTQVVKTLAILFLVGASVAATVFYALLEQLASFGSYNVLARPERVKLVAIAAGSGALLASAAGLYAVIRPTRRAIARLHRLALGLLPLTLLFAVPFFLDWRMWVGNELLVSLYIVSWGLVFERMLRISLGVIPSIAPLREDAALAFPRLTRWAAPAITGVLAAAFVVYFAYYTVLHHYQLETNSYDMGIFDNLMWNLLRGSWFYSAPVMGLSGSHIQYHATFTAHLFAPFYALRQKADTLLVLQATLPGLAAIPLYKLVRHRLRSPWIAVAFVIAYLLYAPLHSPLFYDFHFVTTLPFFVFWTLYFFETKRRAWLIVMGTLALLTREDVSVGLACTGLFYVLSGERPRWALFGAIVSALYLGLVKFVVMPAHALFADASFAYIYQSLIPAGEFGLGAVLLTIVSNPVFVLKWIFMEDKLRYVLLILTPLLLLPLRHGRAWTLLLPGIVLTLFSTGYAPVIQTYFQYTMHWVPYVFLASAVVLGSWRGAPDGRLRITAATLTLLVVSLLMSYHFGAILQQNTFRGGFYSIRFNYSPEDSKRKNDLYALIAMIPPQAVVSATEREVPHVSNRQRCYTMRNDYYDAEYILVRSAEAAGVSRPSMQRALSSGLYGHVATRGEFMLWRRGADTSRNNAEATAMGIRLAPSADKATGSTAPASKRPGVGPTPEDVDDDPDTGDKKKRKKGKRNRPEKR